MTAVLVVACLAASVCLAANADSGPELALGTVRALVLAVAGASITAYLPYRLNKYAKQREQDHAQFNELIKPRIAALHDLHGRVVALAVDYLHVLALFEKRPNSKDSLESASAPNPVELRKNTEAKLLEEKLLEEARHAVGTFLASLPTRVAEVMRNADAVRYIIGEPQYRQLHERLDRLVDDLNFVWDYFWLKKCPQLLKMQGDIKSDDSPDRWREYWNVFKLNYRAFAALSRRRIERLLDELLSDFESLIRNKGGVAVNIAPKPVRSQREATERMAQQVQELTNDALEGEIEEEARRQQAK
jgi:hypothetical protein